MSITLVQSASTNQLSGSSLALAFSSNVTSGNAIIVAVGGDIYPNSVTISDGVNTYTSLTEVGFSGSASLRFFYAFGVVAGATTITATAGSGNVRSIAIHEYSGVVGYDVSVSNTGTNGASQTSGNLTTNFASELLFGATVFSVGSGGMLSQNADTGNGFTKEQASPSGSTTYSLWTEDKTVSSIGTYSMTSSVTFVKGGGSGNWLVELASFYGALNTTVTGVGAEIDSAVGVGTVVLKPTPAGAASTAAGTCGTITGTAHIAGVGAQSVVSGTCGSLPLKGVGASSTILPGVGEITGSAVVTGAGASGAGAGTCGTLTGTANVAGIGAASSTVGSVGVIVLKPAPAGASTTGAATAGTIVLKASITGPAVTCAAGVGLIRTDTHLTGIGTAVLVQAGVGDVTCNSVFPMIAFLGQ